MSTDRRLHVVEGITVEQVRSFRRVTAALPQDGSPALLPVAIESEYRDLYGRLDGKPLVAKGVYAASRSGRRGFLDFCPPRVPSYSLGYERNGRWFVAILDAVDAIVADIPVIDAALIANVDAALGGPTTTAYWKTNRSLDSEDERTPIDFLREHMGKRVFAVAW